MAELVQSDYRVGTLVRADVAARAISISARAVFFYSLLAIVALTSVPYGAAEPWWKAFFEFGVFLIASATVIHRVVRADYERQDLRIFLPFIGLILYALFQTIPLRANGEAISADGFETRSFVVELASLVVFAWLIRFFVDSQRRLLRLTDLLIAMGFVSACFGLVRQFTQHTRGFFLPALEPGYGYAQFINANHFAFMMEMCLGLALGLCAARCVNGNRLKIYLVLALPMWIALVFSNSRAGILSMLFQLVFVGIVMLTARSNNARTQRSPWATGRKLALRIVFVIALLIAATTAVIYVGGDPLANKFESANAELNAETARSYVLRRSIWSATWKMIKDHPVAGVGFVGYWIAVSKYQGASGEIVPQQAHNDYLEMIASGGIVGAMLVTWALVEFGLMVRRKLRSKENFTRALTLAALAGIVTVALHSIVDFGLHITVNAVLLTALLSIAVINVGPEKKQYIAKSS